MAFARGADNSSRAGNPVGSFIYMKGQLMAGFKNDKGLTLIELLITISVLAIVSAIALPVINNVVSSSNSNAAAQTQGDVDDFITKYNAAGETLFAGSELSGYVDTNGDNIIQAGEKIDTLTIDSKFSISVTGTSDNVGGSYTTDGVTAAAIAGGSGSGTGSGSTFGTLTTNTPANLASSMGWPVMPSGAAEWSEATPVQVIWYVWVGTDTQGFISVADAQALIAEKNADTRWTQDKNADGSTVLWDSGDAIYLDWTVKAPGSSDSYLKFLY